MNGPSRNFKGIGASPGVAIGRVFLLDRREVRTPRYHIASNQIEHEIERLREAISKSVEQLEGIRGHFVGEGMDHQTILEAHEMMLRDRAMFDEAVSFIKTDECNAEWAVNRVLTRLRGLFERIDDSYFRERLGDIDFVGERILRNLVGHETDVTDASLVQDDSIVVAQDLSPVDTALLARHNILAFVTEAGGKTSHTSIIARSLDVPAVVGAHGIFEAAGAGDMAVVDGSEGSVVLRPTRTQLERGERRAQHYERVSLDLLEARALPAITLDGHRVVVAGNIELPNEVPTVVSRGGEGVGLYRTEFMFVGRHEPPSEEDHYRTYCAVLDEMNGRPVTIRTFDLGGDKSFDGAAPLQEPNPALGLRAVRYCLANPKVFEPQLAGLLRAASHGPLKIMLPMISGVDELRQAREMLAQVSERLTREGKAHRADVEVGIMVEVPSAVVTADVLAKEAAFFAVGTNDLLQYLLAIDRTNDRVAYLYDPLHPAVLRTLKTVADAAHAAGIPVSVCGEMAGDAEQTPILLGFGFEQLSMNAGSIPTIKRLVRELRRDDCEELLREALGCCTHVEVDELVQEFLSTKAPQAASMWDEQA